MPAGCTSAPQTNSIDRAGHLSAMMSPVLLSLFLLVTVSQSISPYYKTCRETVCPGGCKCIDTSITYIPRPRCVPQDCDYRICSRECNSTSAFSTTPGWYTDGADHTKISSRQDASVKYPERENTSYGASTVREPQLLTIPAIAPLLFTKLCFQQAISTWTDSKHCLSHHQHVSDEMSFSADCRYCAETVNDSSLLVSPCKCSGTMQYVHQECLQQDFVINQRKKCQACKAVFAVEYRWKRLSQWTFSSVVSMSEFRNVAIIFSQAILAMYNLSQLKAFQAYSLFNCIILAFWILILVPLALFIGKKVVRLYNQNQKMVFVNVIK